MKIDHSNKDLVRFEDFKKVWEKDFILIFDTNFLLCLYNYSPSVTSHFLKLIEDNIERIWLPDQVLKEFRQNHENVRNNAYGKFKEFSNSLNVIINQLDSKFFKKFENYKRYKFSAIEELECKLNKLKEEMSSEIKAYKNTIEAEDKNNRLMIKQNTINEFVNKLIDKDAIGPKFKSKELLTIYKEGEERYKYKIPPGYMDSGKNGKDETGIKKFGDLILWKQILKYAQRHKQPIIIVIYY